MFEAPKLPHTLIEGVLSGMTERRMAEIMSEADRFHEILV